jgi:hypothetical protein
VWAYNEATGTTGLYTVTAVLVHDDPVEVRLRVGGEQITTTPEHPFFTLERGWVAAGDLWRGAHIRRADGSFALLWDLAVDARPDVCTISPSLRPTPSLWVPSVCWCIMKVSVGLLSSGYWRRSEGIVRCLLTMFFQIQEYMEFLLTICIDRMVVLLKGF